MALIARPQRISRPRRPAWRVVGSIIAVLLLGATPGARATHIVVTLNPAETIKLDGVLDEPVWQRAPVHDTFWQFDPPADHQPAPARTTVQIAADAKALYFAIRAYDPGGAPAPGASAEPLARTADAPAAIAEGLRAPFVRFDRVYRDQDFVVVYLDPAGTRRSSQFFRVNARGALADGLYTAATDNEDFAPDFDWDAATQQLPDGYAVEIRIPFSSLRFERDGSRTWRVMVARRWPREQTWLMLSVDLPRGSNSFIAALEPLEDFQPPPDELFLQLRPALTLRTLSEHPDDPSTKRHDAQASLDLKLRPTPAWVVDAAINPDFSQLELDVAQLSRNSQFALQFNEKRPFFLEGRDLFEMRANAVYTRAITDPQWGARATYRSQTLAGTLLTTRDDGRGSVLLPSAFGTGVAPQPASHASIGRLRWDGDGVSVGGLVSDRSYRDSGATLGSNRVGGADLFWQSGSANRVRAQWLHAVTTARADDSGNLARADAVAGDQFNVQWDHNDRNGANELEYTRVGHDFRNDNGFVAQAGYENARFYLNRRFDAGGGFNELVPYLSGNRSQALDGKIATAQQLAGGVEVTGPNGLDAEIQWRPLNAERADALGRLHPIPQTYLRVTAIPGRWLTYLNTWVEIGKRVDYAADRPRPSLAWLAEGRIRLGDRIEMEPYAEQIRLSANGGTLLSESVLRLLGVFHLSSRDTIRLIGQRVQATRVEEAGSALPAFDDTTRTGTLLYTHRRSPGTLYYVGAARSRTSGTGAESQATEFFVKVQVEAY